MEKRNGNNGNHGAKGRSGRKPKAFTLLKQRIESEKKDDAEFAFALFASVMRDENAIIQLRLDCAEWITNRVLGKPNQSVAVTMTWREKAKELGYDPDQIIHQVATTIAAVGFGSGDTGTDGTSAGESEAPAV